MILRVIVWIIALLLAGCGLSVMLLVVRARQIKQQPFEAPPPVRQSHLHLFMDGRQFFDDLKNELHAAQSHIHLSFYIFRNDLLGKSILDQLKAKAKEGVQVRLLLDAIGSRQLPSSLRKELKIAGVQLAFSEKPKLGQLFKSINIRNHRKITIIDGKTGYYGGYNVGDEYIGRDSRMGHWRDYHVRISGENVKDLQSSFIEDWKKATQTSLKEDGIYFPRLEPGASKVQFFPTPEAASLERLLSNLLSDAQKKVFIGTPYFNPSDEIMEKLVQLLKSGVEMTILLPAKKDHPLVKPLSYSYLEKLVRLGARVFHYYQGFYHSKVILVDEERCFLGTANFDRRSLFLNLEMNSLIQDPLFINDILEKTKTDIMGSTELTLRDFSERSWLEKTKTVLCQPFAPIL